MREIPPKTPLNSSKKPQKLSPEKYARLRAELKTPYKGVRQFIYITFGASGAIGAFLFLMQLLAGREIDAALPNLTIQLVVVALMIWLFRLEQRTSRKP
jgi:ATP/ADP translocase